MKSRDYIGVHQNLSIDSVERTHNIFPSCWDNVVLKSCITLAIYANATWNDKEESGQSLLTRVWRERRAFRASKINRAHQEKVKPHKNKQTFPLDKRSQVALLLVHESFCFAACLSSDFQCR